MRRGTKDGKTGCETRDGRRSLVFCLMAVALAGSAFGATVSSAPRCLLVNEDNDHFFKLPSSWMDRAGLLRYLNEVLQGPVTHFVMCVNGQRTSYASETWEPIWTGIGEPARKDTATHPDGTHDRWAVNAKRLFDQGIDPYEVWIGECRKRGVEAWVSMRMNDYHFADVTNYFRNTTFCRTRRDLWVEQSPKTWAGHALDYAKKEVRDYSLRQIREMCRRWDADGIELDWMRSPPHFRKGAGRANAAVLTAFMREVRAETERVGKARNRKYKLAVRVPPTPGESSETGIDVATWLREGLVDAIVPSNLFCPDPTLPIGEWADLAREANPSVELYPCVNCFHHTSAASIRASAAAYLGARVDGIYLFNAPYVGKRDTDGRKHKEDSFGKICREGLFPAQASVETADAVIVGSTPAGISAAVQLARMGKKAIVLSPTDRIGGMTTGGLGRTDVGRPEAFGGIARDFYRSVSAYATGDWSERTQWCFSPSAALRLLEILEKRERLDIRRGERIDRSKVNGGGSFPFWERAELSIGRRCSSTPRTRVT